MVVVVVVVVLVVMVMVKCTFHLARFFVFHCLEVLLFGLLLPQHSHWLLFLASPAWFGHHCTAVLLLLCSFVRCTVMTAIDCCKPTVCLFTQWEGKECTNTDIGIGIQPLLLTSIDDSIDCNRLPLSPSVSCQVLSCLPSLIVCSHSHSLCLHLHHHHHQNDHESAEGPNQAKANTLCAHCDPSPSLALNHSDWTELSWTVLKRRPRPRRSFKMTPTRATLLTRPVCCFFFCCWRLPPPEYSAGALPKASVGVSGRAKEAAVDPSSKFALCLLSSNCLHSCAQFVSARVKTVFAVSKRGQQNFWTWAFGRAVGGGGGGGDSSLVRDRWAEQKVESRGKSRKKCPIGLPTGFDEDKSLYLSLSFSLCIATKSRPPSGKSGHKFASKI